MNKRTLLVVLIVVAIAIGILFLFQENKANFTVLSPVEQLISTTDATPTPEPILIEFADLTIPYLREKVYESNLATLDQALETANYIGYLTSYTSDGLRINGLLAVPKSDPPPGGFPAVVFVHGYIPPARYRTLENYGSYVAALANQGIVVFKIDLRGHDQSEGESSGAYYSGDYVIDVLNAYSALQKVEFVNSQNIGLWGHSMAGNVVFRALSVKQSIPKVVIWAGAVYTYVDFGEFGIDDNSYQPPSQESESRKKRDELFKTYGQFDSASPFWRQVPATNYLDGITGEVQVHHAVNDAVVDIRYSQNLMRVLDGTAIAHRLYEYNSGGHNITGAAFTQAMNRSAEFFKR